MKKVFGALALCSVFLFFRRDFWSGAVEADVAPAKVASAKLSETLKVEEQKRRKYAFLHTSKTSRRSFCEAEGWDLEWSDEFSGDSLNLTSWELVSSKGGYDNIDLPVGGLNVTACRCAACRRENAVVEDGKLRIISERDPEDNTRYYSAALSTKGRLSWTTDNGPFRVCIRAKLPLNTRGVWPAHWMLPENGLSDKCLDEGEMDILEMVSGDGKAYHAYHWMSSWPGSHCADFETFHRSVSSSMIVREYSTEFHEYAVERTPDGIRYAIDGVPTGSYRAVERGFTLSSAPWFLILNTAIGGGWPGYPAPEVTSMPVEHVIDWVRVVRRRLHKPPRPAQTRSSLCSWGAVASGALRAADLAVKNTFIHVDDGELANGGIPPADSDAPQAAQVLLLKTGLWEDSTDVEDSTPIDESSMLKRNLLLHQLGEGMVVEMAIAVSSATSALQQP
ncbi:Beta-glucanase [Symbiodinium microadriaticum]|uniref:Beta-glucanase n=1 Tax=Symbiodinium microadriaticum TaxID=2951 RepID=A0A1Q9E0W3_SYMMI|nr:Beta-glucanase [Symbiodinium microadriaticum]